MIAQPGSAVTGPGDLESAARRAIINTLGRLKSSEAIPVLRKYVKTETSFPKWQAIRVLGELEAAVIEILWAEPGLTVVDVEERLRRRREIAHTTVLTTLDRIHRKGYLSHEKQGKAYVYSPTYSRQEFEQRMEGSAIRRIGHERWLRNIAVALGNAPRSPEIVAALRARADDPSPLVREHVVWALERHG